MQTAIPCTIMRGGTSRGPFFLANDLPLEWDACEKVLLAAIGSADSQHINGIGGGTSLTSKVAIVSVSKHPEADIDYLFAQVSVDEMIVDTSPSCGNMMAGTAPFAIENGLVSVTIPETTVKVRNVNTDSIVEVVVQTPRGAVEYEGRAAIDGVNGTSAPIVMNFLDVAGTKTGKLLPTGNARDTFDDVEVSCVDAGTPMVLIPAASLGKTGWETKAELDADAQLIERIESIRLQASLKMGLGDARGKVLPKVGLLSKPQHGGTITSRYFVPDNCHAAHAVTGAICVSTAAMLEGSITDEIVERSSDETPKIVIEHPSGTIDILLSYEGSGADMKVSKAGLLRTARKIFRGELYVPGEVWSPFEYKAS